MSAFASGAAQWPLFAMQHWPGECLTLAKEANGALAQRYHISVLMSGEGTLQVGFAGHGQAPPPLAAAGTTTVITFADGFFDLNGCDRELLLLNNLFQQSGPAHPLVVVGTECEAFTFLLTSLRQEYEGLGLLRESLLRSYLKVLLIRCLRLSENYDVLRQQASQPSFALTAKFRELVEQHFATLKTVGQYAERLHVTPNHLSETMKKSTGRTASEHIRHRVISEAQRLTTLSHLSLKEIAYKLGYDDVAQFSKLFKREVSRNFSQYREQSWALAGENQPAAERTRERHINNRNLAMQTA